MNQHRKLRLQLLMQNRFFVVLFLALVFLIGFISREYHISKDVTQSSRNTLSEGSINVLKQMKGPVHIRIFASKDDKSKGQDFRKRYGDFVMRYQRTKPDITMEFIDLAENPKLVQEVGIRADGEFVVEFNKRSEHILPPFVEQDMTNLLVRLSRSNTRPVMFLDAHGERNLLGKRNHDLGEFGAQLEKKGFKLANPDLLIAQSIPSNGAMLMIASPQVDLTEVEVKKIKQYLDAGGNLFWLLDDNNFHGLQPIADYLGLKVSDGMVVDQSSVQYGANPTDAFASQYGDHKITKSFMLRTVFPEARQIDAQGTFENGWKVSKLVYVAQNGWLETGKTDGSFNFDAKTDKPGPINIALAMERAYGKRGQRVVIVGNGNFLANTFIANEGNLDLGVNMINWLSGDDDLITIQPKVLKDTTFVIPQSGWKNFAAYVLFVPIFGISFGLFPVIIPLILLFIGVRTWLKRKKA